MYLHIDYVPHFGTNREVLGFFTLITDITDRKKIEESLQNANERLSTVLNSITEAYYAFDSDWKLVEINREAEKILGPARHLLGRVFWEKFLQNVGTEFERQYHIAVKNSAPCTSRPALPLIEDGMSYMPIPALADWRCISGTLPSAKRWRRSLRKRGQRRSIKHITTH